MRSETHTIAAGDGGGCALTSVAGPGMARRPPVVLVPGMFTGRRFWLSDRGVGLAAYLAERGHPVFIVQRRGLSDSPPSRGRAGLSEHVEHDLPAVQQWVWTRHPVPAFWVGHSFGGVMCALACADYLCTARMAGLVLLASQFEVGKRMLDWPANRLTRGLARLRGHFPARAAGLGPENEPLAAIIDATRWVESGRRRPDIRQALSTIDIPVLALSGAADRVDPSEGCRRFVDHFASTDRTFERLGRATGYPEDFDHPGLVVSRPARERVWPRIAGWMSERT
ncbi:alpha/beta fold hydrolase [Salinisphaera sp. T31B1]|uniref:alpha/beta fold hydrolase n=1 Tax=Salinisphaera sp. T31B1 TaxID=727963 RepID=UPI00333FA801